LELIGILKDGEIYDLQSVKALGLEVNEQNDKEIKDDGSKESLEILRHSCAHLMAQAIKSLYPEAKFFVGPVVNEGFYYDFRVNSKINEEDLIKIEKKMKEFASAKLDIIRHELNKKEAEEKFKNDDLKQAVLSKIESNKLSTYKQGDFEDLCRGPHLQNTKMIRNFKLIRVAGAYLGGDEKNEMLTRIYGIAFFEKNDLKEYAKNLEEAKKRDHRKLGTALGLFTFKDEIGAGLPLWLPNGARLKAKLEKILFKAHMIRGYEPVRGPEILKAQLWEQSGHDANYRENMYFTNIDEQKYGLKPMNCISHVLIFKNDLVSYKDLPKKYFEYGVVHRHEKSGVMHGLLRVREFTQDDAHIFCMQSQIKDIITEILEFLSAIMKLFDFTYEIDVSTKPQKAIGDDKLWEVSTNEIKNALEENNLNYGIDEGGGAFYGPKIDFKILDALGRQWQCSTIQVDMNLPERFDLSYIDEHGEKQRPVMIHRAILGSFERFIGILTEHYAGEFPFAIAPMQVIIIPISSEHEKYAKELLTKLLNLEIFAKIDSKNESLGKRIRTAEKEKVPMIVVLGDKEVQNQEIALRNRRTREQSTLSLEDFLKMLELANKEGEI